MVQVNSPLKWELHSGVQSKGSWALDFWLWAHFSFGTRLIQQVSVFDYWGRQQTKERNDYTTNHWDHSFLLAWQTVTPRQEEKTNHTSQTGHLHFTSTLMGTTPSPEYQQLPHVHLHFEAPHSMIPIACVMSTCCWPTCHCQQRPTL